MESSIIDSRVVLGPWIKEEKVSQGSSLYALPSIGPGEFSVAGTFRNSPALPISYLSPAFWENFIPLKEQVSERIYRLGWSFKIESIKEDSDLSVSRARRYVFMAGIYSLLVIGSLPADGKVTVTCVHDYENVPRLVTIRWGGRGWIIRSYPLDFKRVIRTGRMYIGATTAP